MANMQHSTPHIVEQSMPISKGNDVEKRQQIADILRDTVGAAKAAGLPVVSGETTDKDGKIFYLLMFPSSHFDADLNYHE